MFNLTICQNKFKQKGKLDRHMMNVHEDSTKLNCGQCDKAFTDKSKLNRHVKNVHSNQ